MKAIEKEFTEKKIVGYEAFDGTYFKKEEECEEYEKSAKGVTKSRVHALVINEDSEAGIFGAGSDENTVWLVIPKSRDDVDLLRQLIILHGNKPEYAESWVKDDDIGHPVILTFGYDGCDVWTDRLDAILQRAFGGKYEVSIKFTEKKVGER